MRQYEEPVVTPGDGLHVEGETISHPSFAQISVSRISGHRALYGSDFNHKQYVRIRIAKSVLHRSLSHDWPHASTRPYIEVDLSEAQWATMVSSFNVGEGVQCTLARFDGKEIPQMPDPVSHTAQFTQELRSKIGNATKALRALEEKIDGMKLSEKQKNELRSGINHARMEISSNSEFVAESFDRHVEDGKEKAKVEINAYLINTMRQAGMLALAEKGELPLQLANSDE